MHEHMFRDFLTGQWGEEITSTTSGTFIDEYFTYTIPDEFNDVPVSLLELEILETAVMHDINYVRQVMLECSELGFSFALDDFGTGYSSLTYLKNLPAEVIKIDQSFVRGLLDNPDDVTIVQGILGLAKAFKRTPIAEGVETAEHGVLLLNLGCELGQGYGISHPISAEKLLIWLSQSNSQRMFTD